MDYRKVVIISIIFALSLCSCDRKYQNIQTDIIVNDSNNSEVILQDTDTNKTESERSVIAEIRKELGNFMNGNYIVCEQTYIAYITSSGMVYLQPVEGEGRYIKELGAVISIFGSENELAALDNEGNILIYSIADKTLYKEPQGIEEDYSGFELGGETIAMAAQLKKSLIGLHDIKEINMDYPHWYVVSLQDGTQVMKGFEQDSVYSWNDTLKIESNDSDVIGLTKDGTVLYELPSSKLNEISKIILWSDIIDVEYGSYAFGLKADGTVVSSWINNECEVQQWKDIIQISASYNTTAGLSKDGTVHVAFEIDYGQKTAEEWQGIAAIKAYTYYILGVKEDGSLLITTSKDNRYAKIDLTNAPDAYVPSREKH